MKFTLNWLRDHLDTSATLDDVVGTLTRLGLEVEGVENPAARLAPFTIAHVLSAEPHPNADKLRLCMVDTGSGTPVQVVCGAPNARAGMRAVFAPPGSYVPGIDVTLKISAIRGVESRGMLCSGRELELNDDHDGILDLPSDAPVGTSYAEWAGLDDPVIDIAITPNRQDCLGVHGIARDLAAAGLGILKSLSVPAVTATAALALDLRNDDPAGCPAIHIRAVQGVRNGPSPEWLQKRLRAVGLRPISALVDISNYIMIDVGRPLHFYDLAKLQEALVVRRAQPGETLTALNGKTYALDPDMTVLGDVVRADDIGGIMGGEATAISDSTTDILIECAYFEPSHVALTGRALGINSDARYRFERGVDPAFLVPGLDMATQMVIDLCGGVPTMSRIDTHLPEAPRLLAFRPERVASLGGIDVGPERQKNILESLGFQVRSASSPWQVSVPSWRRDVDGEADLVEEVLRINGYDAIKPTPLARPFAVAKPTATALQARIKRVRYAAAAQGLNEAITWSFIAPEDAAIFDGAIWTLDNPISSEMATMRPSLLPGLLRAVVRNLDRGADRVRLFESGRRYLDLNGGFERATLGFVLAGATGPRDWRSTGTHTFDAYDAKALALALLDAAGVTTDRVQALAQVPDWYHPGQSGLLALDPRTPLAHFGVLHPRVSAQFGLEGSCAVGEIYLDSVPSPKKAQRTRAKLVVEPLQAVRRDFAFIIAEDIPAAKLVSAIRGADKKHIIAVTVFDRFAGKTVLEGHVSLGVEVTLQPIAASFTAEQLEAISKAIIAAAQKATGAVLRQ